MYGEEEFFFVAFEASDQAFKNSEKVKIKEKSKDNFLLISRDDENEIDDLKPIYMSETRYAKNVYTKFHNKQDQEKELTTTWNPFIIKDLPGWTKEEPTYNIRIALFTKYNQ